MGDMFWVIQKVKERGLKGESKWIIILSDMDKGYDNFYTATKPLEISFNLKKFEDMEF